MSHTKKERKAEKGLTSPSKSRGTGLGKRGTTQTRNPSTAAKGEINPHEAHSGGEVEDNVKAMSAAAGDGLST